MEEVYQLTAALKYLSLGREVAVLTDARFSGVSTGGCIGWVTPEALAGGPMGKVRDGDRIRIVIDPQRLEGSVDLIGDVRAFQPGRSGAGLAAAGVSRGACARPGPAVRYAVVGLRWQPPAEGPGAVAFSTWSGSWRGSVDLVWQRGA